MACGGGGVGCLAGQDLAHTLRDIPLHCPHNAPLHHRHARRREVLHERRTVRPCLPDKPLQPVHRPGGEVVEDDEIFDRSKERDVLASVRRMDVTIRFVLPDEGP